MKISKKKRIEQRSLLEAPRTKKVKSPSKFLPCHRMKLRPRPSVSGSFSKLPKEMVENILKLVTCRELAMVEACSSYFREHARDVWKEKAKVAGSEEVSKVTMRTERLNEEFVKNEKEQARLDYQIPEMDDIDLYIQALKQQQMELNQAFTSFYQLKEESLTVVLKLKRAVKLKKLLEDRSWKEVLKVLA